MLSVDQSWYLLQIQRTLEVEKSVLKILFAFFVQIYRSYLQIGQDYTCSPVQEVVKLQAHGDVL